MPITKKHKSILFSGIALMAGATLLAGCSADPLPVSKSEQYTRDFIKTFGAFDQSHDWNHATQATVTVTTPAPTEVKIMADFEGKRYIFATYTNVEGTKTLNVDIPKGISDLIVAANGKNYSVKAGGEVSLTGRGSRTVFFGQPGEGNENFMTVEDAGKSIEATYDYIGLYDVMLPEDKKNMNKPGVSVNFRFNNPGKPFIIYPVMWQTNRDNTIGIYYKDDNGTIHTQDVYAPKNGNYLHYKQLSINTDESTEYIASESGIKSIYLEPWAAGVQDIVKSINKKKYGNENTTWLVSNKNNWTVEDFNELKEGLIALGWDITLWEAPGQWTGCPTEKTEVGTGVWGDNGEIKETIEVPYKIADGSDSKTLLTYEYLNYPRIAYKTFNVTETAFSGQTHTFGKLSMFGSYLDDADYMSKIWYVSKGIKVTIPAEIKEFGFFIKNNTATLYSESQLNEGFEMDWDVKWTDDAGNQLEEGKVILNQPVIDIPVAATFMKDGFTTSGVDTDKLRRIGFEDAFALKGVMNTPEQGNGAFGDYNDIIIYIEGLTDDIETGKPGEEIPEPDPDPETKEWKWIIACEDLGTNDFDFNDVVFSVSGTTTENENGKETKTVKVKALAAGGTMPVYIYFDANNDKQYDDDERIRPTGTDGEFNKWFGNHPSHKVINAIKNGERYDGAEVTIEVPSNFTMACDEKDNMSGFAVGVIYPDKKEIIKAISPYNFEDKNAGMIGTAPQMICVPGTWAWPTENTFILDVYGDFKGWCAKPESNLHWHENRTGNNYWQ